MKKLFQSEWISRLLDALLPVFAAIAALLIGAVMLFLLKVNPIEAYKALWDGAFGSSNAFAETLVKATPLLLVGIGICISFRGDVINIGGEGQMIIGAILATWVGLTFTGMPGWLVITLSMVAGFIGGGIWGGIPGILKAYFRVNEILSTVMMNAIAVQLMNFLLRGPMIDPLQAELASKIPQTARLLDIFRLPRLAPTRLHLGALIAVVLAVLVYILLWRTTLGYRIRAVVTGFALVNATGYATSSQVVGKVFAADMVAPTPINLTTAVNNMVTAYTDAAGRPSPDFTELGAGIIGGQTLTPGLYKWSTAVTIPTDVTISGGANDVWIFQIAGNLTMSSAVKVILSGGAQAKNIFWQVAGQATLGTTAHFEGIILSKTGITLQTGASINGRAFAQTAVILDKNAVTQP